MSELRLSTLTLPTADLGPLNPLPPLFGAGLDQHADTLSEPTESADADPELLRNLAYGRVDSVLPHLLQDGYARERRPREHPVAVLENEHLRAIFLLRTGGRLWSLAHRPSGRELLHRNPVFQPANLALRNAWVAGGVEWNIGTIGHSTTTCDPVHAVRARRPDGTPVLRMYEFERLRRVVFRIDAWLPDGSEVLLVRVRIANPHRHETPMYWWSNIAVPETADTRVLAPAASAWRFGYERQLRKVPFPHPDPGGADASHPAGASAAADYFFDLAPGQRPWVAALGGDGSGLVQTSSARLRGRKLFLWGRHQGGEHWQDWLNGGTGQRYLEIQAGLARTQLEHLPMPPGAAWSWLEAYGRIEADPAVVHGADWARAREEVERRLDGLLTAGELDSLDSLDAELTAADGRLTTPPVAVLHHGTGWGALERHLRARSGDSAPELHDPATPFPDETLGPEQEPWLTLLTTGRITGSAPASYQTDPAWEPLLTAAGGWLAELHLGVLLSARGEQEAAAAAWRRSLQDAPNTWAWRNLGALAAHRGDHEAAVDAYLHAYELTPRLLPLLYELLTVLLDSGRPHQALALAEKADTAHPGDGRLRLLEARAALEAGDPDRCGALLRAGIEVPTLREGELSLAALWSAYRGQRPEAGPLPAAYDFGMAPDPDPAPAPDEPAAPTA